VPDECSRECRLPRPWEAGHQYATGFSRPVEEHFGDLFVSE
jgi:hypothetical protein